MSCGEAHSRARELVEQGYQATLVAPLGGGHQPLEPLLLPPSGTGEPGGPAVDILEKDNEIVLRGELRCIGATTLNDFKKHIERDPALEVLFREGYEPAYGARPMKRALQRLVQNPLAQKILKGEVLPGDTMTVDADSRTGELTFLRAVEAMPA